MRGGGAGGVLNSCSEFNRCYIPRLRVEEQDRIKDMEEQYEMELKCIKETLREEDTIWEKDKNTR